MAARTISTFSCDIARAVSRLAVRLPMAALAERFTHRRAPAPLGPRVRVVSLHAID